MTDKTIVRDIISKLVSFDINQVVISPGSRNAPFIIGFDSHSKVETYSIVDERCAGFVAMGMAQTSGKPVVLLCTSGSALLNYYPAIVEAYYSNIPLIVISADRLSSHIDIGDGQTIRQNGVFDKHCDYSVNLQEGEGNYNEKTEELIRKSIENKTPAHINIGLSEPLYGTIYNYNENIESIYVDYKVEDIDLRGYSKIWNKSAKKVFLIGVREKSEELLSLLKEINKDESVLVLTESTSNMVSDDFIPSIDLFLQILKDKPDFCPDVLVTFEGAVVSKKIKQLFREYKPKNHWHISGLNSLDTFGCLTKNFDIDANSFIKHLLAVSEHVNSGYGTRYIELYHKALKKHEECLKTVNYSDLKVFESIFKTIPSKIKLHLSNSSVVRYAQLFEMREGLNVNSNRGASGIDGSTSTAIGNAMNSKKQNVLITGDISFFYDSNALWNIYIPNNFRIILINNDGGGIFKILPGPDKTKSAKYFQTPHGYTAELLCKMYGFEYNNIDNLENIDDTMSKFYDKSEKPKLLEIDTRLVSDSHKVLKSYFEYIEE
ncbi:MAG: 2-succinyl-5-enolpyruvyl-6-hydroxy-3-cyclohexene-1-carboxylic-acid synthase [Flavobacteriaceae bacterium]|nr:2-succinyl-5-enolpyruvyl-6-hydroxy-3-cyclohexene-1-carboxylic-acid synthase [Flavobacteriaceae bacterium]